MDGWTSVCPSICPFIHLSVRLSICPSICPSVCLSVCPSVCLSVRPFVHPSMHPSVHSSIHLSVHLSVNPFHVWRTFLKEHLVLSYIGHGYGMDTRSDPLSCCSVNTLQWLNSQWEQIHNNYDIQNEAEHIGILSLETNYSADRKSSIDNIRRGFVDVEYNGK